MIASPLAAIDASIEGADDLSAISIAPLIKTIDNIYVSTTSDRQAVMRRVSSRWRCIRTFLAPFALSEPIEQRRDGTGNRCKGRQTLNNDL
jgi:hypothetical protein